MKIKTSAHFVIVVIICMVLLFVFIVPDSGSAQDPTLIVWRRAEQLPEGLIASCQDTAEYECGVLCGKEYADGLGLDVTPLGCVAFRFPTGSGTELGTESTHLPIITTQETEK